MDSAVAATVDDGSNETSVFADKHLSLRIVVGATCVLSMAGALSIILSYACIRTLQSQGRLILVNLALMDFGVGLSNLSGAVINFDQYYRTEGGHTETDNRVIDRVCIAQAIFAHYCTSSSVLWTTFLAVYMYMLVFHNHQKSIKYFLPFSCIVCYVVPLMLTIWLLLTKRLGYSIYTEAAWCGLIVSNNSYQTGLPDYVGFTVGYDIWIYMTIVLSVSIYTGLLLYLHIEYHGARRVIGNLRYWKQALQFLDAKLIFIPFAFIALRMWTCILNILLLYARIPPGDIPKSVSQTLIYLSGIGDSGQGLVNGVLFVLLTADVRKKLFGCSRRRSKALKQIEDIQQSTRSQAKETDHLLVHHNVSFDSPFPSLHGESDVDA